eukprot:gene7298-368_t
MPKKTTNTPNIGVERPLSSRARLLRNGEHPEYSGQKRLMPKKGKHPGSRRPKAAAKQGKMPRNSAEQSQMPNNSNTLNIGVEAAAMRGQNAEKRPAP